MRPVQARFDDFRSGSAIMLKGYIGELRADHVDDVAGLLHDVEAAAAAGRYAAGLVAYEAAAGLDPSLTVRTGTDRPTTPLAWFGLFEEACRVPLVQSSDGHGLPAWQADTVASAHRRSVAAIRRAIAAGRVYQVNHTIRLCASDVDNPESLYRHLAIGQQGAYHAFLQTSDWAVLCASPELFLELHGNDVITRPMKGTARRGRWPGEDAERCRTLAQSAKERAENIMVVDLLRNDLGKVAEVGTVRVARLLDVEAYPSVWQVTSTITARRRDEVGLAGLFEAVFPSGSVTGAPKREAMRMIAELEETPRGVYCGVVGLVGPEDPFRRANGTRPQGMPDAVHARFAVAIRTAVVDKRTGTASYGAGGGITWGSEARAEWIEVQAKTSLLRRPTPRPSGLFETLAWHPQHGAPLLDRHLQRLGGSAKMLGLAFDDVEIRRLVTAAVTGSPSTLRIRIVLDTDGSAQVDTAPPPAHPTRALRLAIDDELVDPDDPLLFHKTLDRTRYDRCSARHPAADDVVLVNQRGEVTETTRANLGLRIGGRWWTPPIGSGCLPGIRRSLLVESGVVAERPLTVHDLRRAEAVATFSSLRGWLAAVVEPIASDPAPAALDQVAGDVALPSQPPGA